MKLKVMEYNGDIVFVVAGERQNLIIREEEGFFSLEIWQEGKCLAMPSVELVRTPVKSQPAAAPVVVSKPAVTPVVSAVTLKEENFAASPVSESVTAPAAAPESVPVSTVPAAPESVLVSAAPAAPEVVKPINAGLFAKLSDLRKELAAADGVPPFMVFHNKTLNAMIESMPQDMLALSRISGIGKAKLDKYGARFLAIITGAVA